MDCVASNSREALSVTSPEVLPVKFGNGWLVKHMTRDQARKFGHREMPLHLKRLGWEVCVFRSDPVIHGSNYFCVSFGK